MIDWGWFYFITKPLFWRIDYIYKYVGNFGFAILIITVLIKLAFFPLANRSYESMAKMKAVQPEMKACRNATPTTSGADAKGADGALQTREDQSGRGLLAGARCKFRSSSRSTR